MGQHSDLARRSRVSENTRKLHLDHSYPYMSNILAVLLNGIAQLEYDRDRALPPHQAAYLDKMDSKMDAGIMIGNETVTHPDINQRAQFIAGNLHSAIKSNDEEMSAALCTWLANRLPDLKQVQISEASETVTIDLVFDQEYQRQTAVTFNKLN